MVYDKVDLIEFSNINLLLVFYLADFIIVCLLLTEVSSFISLLYLIFLLREAVAIAFYIFLFKFLSIIVCIFSKPIVIPKLLVRGYKICLLMSSIGIKCFGPLLSYKIGITFVSIFV